MHAFSVLGEEKEAEETSTDDSAQKSSEQSENLKAEDISGEKECTEKEERVKQEIVPEESKTAVMQQDLKEMKGSVVDEEIKEDNANAELKENVTTNDSVDNAKDEPITTQNDKKSTEVTTESVPITACNIEQQESSADIAEELKEEQQTDLKNEEHQEVKQKQEIIMSDSQPSNQSEDIKKDVDEGGTMAMA